MSVLTNSLKSSGNTRSEFGEEDISDSYFENYTENMYLRYVNHKVDTQQVDGSSLIWNNTTYGIWGSFNWSNGLTTPKVRSREQFMWIDYNEDFTTKNYHPFKIPQLHLTFENGSYDNSTRDRVVTVFGSFAYDNGLIGSAGSFTATGSGYLRSQISSSSNATISGWFYTPSFGTRRFLVNNFNNTVNGWGLELTASGSVAIFNDLADAGTVKLGRGANSGSWNHFAAIYDNGSEYLYVNNVLSGSSTSIGSYSNLNGSIYVGHRGTDSFYFDGLIDDVRVYDIALTGSEISELYNSGSGTHNPIYDYSVVTGVGWGTGSVLLQSVNSSTVLSFLNGSPSGSLVAVAGSITLI